jgi:hypothetical protein
MSHIVLFEMMGENILGVEYIESKWPRKIGEKMNVDGKEMIVGIEADTKTDAVAAANIIIKNYNAKKKARNREKNKKVNAWFNQVLIDSFNSINERINK